MTPERASGREGYPLSSSPHEAHFDSLEKQAHAAKLGMWVFLASEVLLFGALFALYSAARVGHPGDFREGIRHTDKILGSVNTLVLLTSSFTVASAVHALERGKRAGSTWLLLASIALGLAFLVLKGVEWSKHIHDGIVPGGGTQWFDAHPGVGLPLFFTLYYVMTGLHAIHVIIGLCVLVWLTLAVLRGRATPVHAHPLQVGALYWHLVDMVWIFLWPLFYLTGAR